MLSKGLSLQRRLKNQMGRKLSTANVSYPFSPETQLFLSRFKSKVAVVTEMEVIHGLNHENLLPRQIQLPPQLNA